eukprot:Rhum_TRINITY_DN4339_c0_g1::Rhum_TRINITY_DN4339_c0_g1_i1::g.13777::m.13777
MTMEAPLLRLVVPLVCAAVSVWAYRAAFGCELVFDDELAITRNADTDPAQTPWSNLLHHDFWGHPLDRPGSNRSFRPVTVATFRLNRLFAPSAAGHHAVNVALHAVATALVACAAFWHLDRAPRVANGAKTVGAAVCGLLFAVHPVHAEAVTGVVGRAEMLCCICVLLGARVVLRGGVERDGGGCGGFLRSAAAGTAAAVLLLLAALSKETGVTAAAALPVADALLRGRWTPSRAAALPCLAAAAAYTCVRLCVVGSVDLAGSGLLRKTENPVMFASTPLSKALSLTHVQCQYARLLVWPTDMCCEYPFDCVPLVEGWADPRVPHMAGCAAALVALLVVLVRRPFYLTYAVYAAAPYLPASGVLFTIGTMLGERLLYMPTVGLCLLAGHAAARVGGPRASPLALAAAVAVAAVWSETLHARNLEWRSNETLFESALRVCPRGAKHHQQYGVLLLNRRNATGALHHLKRALEIDPDWCEPHLYIGKAIAHEGPAAYVEAQQWWRGCLSCKYVAAECLELYAQVETLKEQNGLEPEPPGFSAALYADAQAALAQWPAALRGYRQAGLARFQAEDWEGAAEALARAEDAWHAAGGEAAPQRQPGETAEQAELQHPCNVRYWQAQAQAKMLRHRSALRVYHTMLDDCAGQPRAFMAAADGAGGVLAEGAADGAVRGRLGLSQREIVEARAAVFDRIAENGAVGLEAEARAAYRAEAAALRGMLGSSAAAADGGGESGAASGAGGGGGDGGDDACGQAARVMKALQSREAEDEEEEEYCKALHVLGVTCGDKEALRECSTWCPAGKVRKSCTATLKKARR